MYNLFKTFAVLVLCVVFTACKDSDNSASGSPDTDAPEFFKQTKSVKRGVGYRFAIPGDDTRLLCPSISWFYNWGPDSHSEVLHYTDFYGVEFYPMAWNGNFDATRIRNYLTSHPDIKYILAFNEPNLTDQAKMTPREAADAWPRLKALADEFNLKVVAPAMNYGTLNGYGDPVKWLDEFFQLVPVTEFSAIALHCYMPTTAGVKAFVERFYKYNLPIWMTEFCAWENTIKNELDQMNYMSETVAYLEADPRVEKYAWFIPRYNGFPYMALLTAEQPYELTACGKVYTQISAQQTDVYYRVGQRIEAEKYTRCNISDVIGVPGSYSGAPHLRPSIDENDETLDITGFRAGQWLEYQLYVPQDATYSMMLRAGSDDGGDLMVYVGEKLLAFLSVNKTQQLEDFTTTITLSKGKHTLRFVPNSNPVDINYFEIKQ